MLRPSWDSYFLQIADLTSKRSNCIKRNVGCVLVKDNRILSLGYNGTASGSVNCFDGGCERCNKGSLSAINLDICMCLHAEENATLFISKSDLENATLYVTLMPCIGCSKKIIQCKIKRVVYIYEYSKDISYIVMKMMSDNNIIIEQQHIN